jgi:8-oxo-dGTP pyrophosphatase MutT (NUDIX family)
MDSNRLPISIKGVVIEKGRVWLRKNPRDEWELPGGRLEEGEQPAETVVREMREELGFEVSVMKILHSGVLSIPVAGGAKFVFIVSYLCELKDKRGEFEWQGEDGEASFKSFLLAELEALCMPEIYRNAVGEALRH